jgi:hypothetical protein
MRVKYESKGKCGDKMAVSCFSSDGVSDPKNKMSLQDEGGK